MPSDITSPQTSYFVGLDLGQSQDPSAIAVLRRRAWPGEKAQLDIVHLRRYELMTPYTHIVEQVVQLLHRPERKGSTLRPLLGCHLGLDQTGVGRPVTDLFTAARPLCRLHPVTITAGHTASHEADGWRVPKKDLVATIQTLLQARRLRWDATLPFAKELAKELADFQVKVTPAANEVFGAWREGQHDDLVLAVAIGAWLAERAGAEHDQAPRRRRHAEYLSLALAAVSYTSSPPGAGHATLALAIALAAAAGAFGYFHPAAAFFEDIAMPTLTKEIIAPGEYYTSDGIVRATPHRIKHWLRQFRRMKAKGLPVPVPWEHQQDAKPRRLSDADRLANEAKHNAGWCQDMFLDKDGHLWAKLEVPDADDAERIRKSVRFVSPEIDDSFQDGDGDQWDDVITHIALTPRPVYFRQRPFGSKPQLSHPRRGCVWLSMGD